MHTYSGFVSNTLKALFVMFSVAFFSSSAIADEMPEPQAIVKAATDKMTQALIDNKSALEENPDLIYSLVTDILMPNFDFEKIAKLALGRNWRGISDEQKQRFTEEFRLLLIRTYSTAMLEYSGQEISFLPFRGDVKSKKSKVAMEIIQPGGPAIPMALSMYQNKEDAWKVYDVKIDGISLVTNYRSTFSNEIRNDGLDKLIERLASKNEKVKVKVEA